MITKNENLSCRDEMLHNLPLFVSYFLPLSCSLTLESFTKAFRPLPAKTVMLVLFWLTATPLAFSQSSGQEQQGEIRTETDAHGSKFDAVEWEAAWLYDPKTSRTIKTVVRGEGETHHQYKLYSDPKTIEQSLILVGNHLLKDGKTNEAIRVLKLNVQLNPNAWSAYNSLGEAYFMAGNKKRAIRNYERSLALNPSNENGKKALAKLRQ